MRLRATLALIAPGTPLRDGLERILRGRTGALIVLGNDRTVESISTGGFALDVPFTATGLRELAKMDGGIIVDKGLTRILRAAVHLMPDQRIPSEETGTRHRTADRVAKQTGHPVISVSQSMQIIAAYVGETRHVLEDSGQILSRANQALATLERYKLRLDEVSTTLSALEIEDLVTVRDVAVVAQRLEMVTRIAREIEDYVLELGTDGRLLSLQLEELVTGVDAERELVIRDYVGRAARPARPRPCSPTSSPCPPPSWSTRWPSPRRWRSASTSTAPWPRAGTACSPRCPASPRPWSTAWSSTSARSRSCSPPAWTTSRPSRVSASCAPGRYVRVSRGWPSRRSSSGTSELRSAFLPLGVGCNAPERPGYPVDRVSRPGLAAALRLLGVLRGVGGDGAGDGGGQGGGELELLVGGLTAEGGDLHVVPARVRPVGQPRAGGVGALAVPGHVDVRRDVAADDEVRRRHGGAGTGASTR